MTLIKRFSLTVIFTLACTLVCLAQEQSKESATNAQTTENASTTENAVGPINGEGTTGKIAKFTGTNAIGNSIITESGKRVAVNFNAPTAHLQVHGPVLGQVPGNGTNASPLLQTSGGKGGNTTGVSAGVQTAGTGASIILQAGNGGDAPAGSNRGNGGNITLQPGFGGNPLNGSPGDMGSDGAVLIAPNGDNPVGIGTTDPGNGRLHVEGGNFTTAVYGNSTVYGVYGNSTHGNGVHGESLNGIGVRGASANGKAGEFNGKVEVNGTLAVSNLAADSETHLCINAGVLSSCSAPPPAVQSDQLSAVLANSVKEQQAQIKEQQKMIEQLQARLAEVERNVSKRRVIRKGR